MKKFKVTVQIFIKPAVLNPEEKVIAAALRDNGFGTVSKISMGKCHIIELEADDDQTARDLVGKMCDKLLTNKVTEHFKIVTIEAL